MTISMITTGTTMMTDVVVVPLLGVLLVGCMLLLTGAVAVSGWVGCMLLLTGAVAVSGWVGLDAVDRKHHLFQIATKGRNEIKEHL